MFACLTARYGREWLRMWEGVSLDVVKADWARGLAGFTQRDVAYALDNLPPDRPPNLGQFRAVCQRAPAPEVARLPAPKPNKARAREALAGLRMMGRGTDKLAWARELKVREESGQALTEAQRQAWRDALEGSGPALSVAQLGEFNPIPKEALPPQMRGAA